MAGTELPGPGMSARSTAGATFVVEERYRSATAESLSLVDDDDKVVDIVIE